MSEEENVTKRFDIFSRLKRFLSFIGTHFYKLLFRNGKRYTKKNQAYFAFSLPIKNSLIYECYLLITL